jgi:hypothetical protein
MLGGRANVKCISSMWRPAGADNGVVVDKAFTSNRRNWCLVEVKKSFYLLVGRFAGITASMRSKEGLV